MLEMVRTGDHHTRADSLNEKLIRGLNETLGRAAVAGCAYGLASYFHIALGGDLSPLADGIEWTGPGAPARTLGDTVGGLKRGMLNHGVDLMGGSGGFVSGVHTEADIETTLAAFEATLGQLKDEEIL
jgi:glutamate-1-semialdehyde 2,1-aminomutase